tara:strand:+ start:72 stop:632 length:561 start_codon:yes stop_codon:yes gene_type:complete
MAAKIPTNGVDFASGLAISDGNLTFASGHGISFAATGDGTNDDSELFDDFEEGTWTGQYKTNSGNATMHSTNRYGRYVKMGRMVKCWGYFGLAGAGSATGGQGLKMTGLPFNITNHANDYNVVSVGYYSGLALEDAEAGIAGYIEISNSTIVFVHTNTGQTNNSNFYLDNLTTDGHLMISMEYLTD